MSGRCDATSRPAGRASRLTATRRVLTVAAGIWLSFSLAHGGSARAQSVAPLELAPHDKVLEVALVEWDRQPGLELAIASSRSTGPKSAERFLSVYRVRANAEGKLVAEQLAEHEVPDDVVAFGVGDLLGAGSRSLLYFTAQSVFALDAAGKPQPVIRGQRLLFSMPSQDALPFWDAVVDLDRDDRDELLLADARGYAIYRREASAAPGSVPQRVARLDVGSDYAKEPLRRRRRTARDEGPLVMRRSLRQIVPADLNADQRVDLIAMKREWLVGYLQREDGSFSEVPDVEHRLVSEKGADSGPVGVGPPPAIVHADVDGDGRVDYVVPELDLADLSTRLRIFLSQPDGLPKSPSQIIKLSSLGTLPELVELNGDGHPDLGISVFRSDRLLSLSANQIQTLDFTYYGFLFDPETRAFSKRPDLRFDASWTVPADEESADERESDEEPGFIRSPGDFSGDGVHDTVLFTAEGAFSVYARVIDDASKRSVSTAADPLLSVTLPPTSAVRFGELSGDGRTDALFLYDDMVRVVVSP